MTKMLILDTDVKNTGCSSVGSDEKIKEVFGFAPKHIKSAKDFNEFMKVLFEEYTVPGSFEKEWRLKAPYNEVDVIAIDTLSGMQTFMKKDIQGAAPSMTQSQWGILGDRMNDILLRFANTNKHLIVMCHTKDDKEGQTGSIYDNPKLQGAMKDDIGAYFDFLMYSMVLVDRKDKKVKYLWQVIPDETRRGCRALPSYNEEAMKYGGLMEQDLKVLMDLASKDYSGPLRICLLGRPGSGKTRCLKTLA